MRQHFASMSSVAAVNCCHWHGNKVNTPETEHLIITTMWLAGIFIKYIFISILASSAFHWQKENTRWNYCETGFCVTVATGPQTPTSVFFDSVSLLWSDWPYGVAGWEIPSRFGCVHSKAHDHLEAQGSFPRVGPQKPARNYSII